MVKQQCGICRLAKTQSDQSHTFLCPDGQNFWSGVYSNYDNSEESMTGALHVFATM